jgi:hypothetical protein
MPPACWEQESSLERMVDLSHFEPSLYPARLSAAFERGALIENES